ncbi:MAG TPA: sigma-70 family RNA polymerase sigma factor [Thermoanaerobaculia bacterium]|jgi:RNA polymerase sigma-70 factor (ECF subfamily)|nr:sigma-70 family RNA polymerase sigma factor [Thermoanaerobaculia bacterium]
MNEVESLPSDQDLIESTLAGDGNAFAMIVERFQRKIFRTARAIVRDDAEADSITQDTFVQAYTHLGRFEGRAELETWLTRIAINKSRDSLRRRRFVSLFTLNADGETEAIIEPVDERPDPERQMMSSELRNAIVKAERGLSSQQKTIFRLRHYENLSLEEIADHLGLRAGTVRAHLFRAIHKIRKELAEWRNARDVQGMEHEAALQ